MDADLWWLVPELSILELVGGAEGSSPDLWLSESKLSLLRASSNK